jgi:hypothetical protein
LQAKPVLADVIGILMSHPERDQLQNCLENALAEFEN